MISFTSDIDWAPEPVILDMLEIFEKYQVKCTLFCTHKSDVLQNCNRELFEVGIHPNYNPLFENKSKDTAREILEKILEIYPESRGVRSHSLTQNSTLLSQFADFGLVYDANQFLPYHRNIKPFKLWTGMWRIPYNWEDDVHWSYGKSFCNPEIDILSPDLHVFNFHPIHVFLNTDCQQTYDQAKLYYQDFNNLKNYINKREIGTRDLLTNLLEQIRNTSTKTFKQIELF